VIARTGRTVPSLKSVAASDAFLDPNEKPKNAQVFLDAVEQIRHLPTISTWPEIEDAANGILENGMYLPNQDPAKVAQDVVETTKPIFARAER
jgi:multiple sugar transport system substrate-binding protein